MTATDQADSEQGAPAKKKGMLMPLLIGLVLAGAGGGGAFLAVSSGLLSLGGGEEQTAAEPEAPSDAPLPDVAFVPLDPISVDLNRGTAAERLRFRAQLEVPSAALEEVTGITPRVIDVLNSYLRALEPSELEEPSALLRLRAQMLRRVQMVAGEGRVRDLLVMEFVLN